MPKAIVIGAGISGLACAFRLKQAGIPCIVVECKDRAGGVIATVRRDGFLFEAGPQFPRFPAAAWQLVRELGLQDQFVAGNPKAKRYIWADGNLQAAPFSAGSILTTPLVGLATKWRLLTEAFGNSHPPEHEESLAEFVKRKFGNDLLNNVVDPVISTIFFGDADKMGMESAFPDLVQWEKEQGSLVRGAIRAYRSKRKVAASNGASSPSGSKGVGGSLRVTDSLPPLGSFKYGMATLTEKLANLLKQEIRYRTGVAFIKQVQIGDGTAKPVWEIGLTNGEKVTAEHLILAVPAYVAAQLLEKHTPRLASLLGAIKHAPMSAVAFAYERSQVANDLDGFGFMVPRQQGLRTICTFWNSSLFPERAPAGKVVITSFARDRITGDIGPESEEACAKTIEAENAKILGITGTAIDRLVWKDARALPQFNVGHAGRVAEIDRILPTIANLHLAGNYLKGRSIGECVELAFRVAEDVRSRVQTNDI